MSADPQEKLPPLPEPVATVRGWTSGSYWRNYQLDWHSDVPEGTKLYAESALAAARAEAEALRADAERYRWFADVATAGNVEALEATFACFEGLDPTRGHLDTAIDVAISAAKRKQS